MACAIDHFECVGSVDSNRFFFFGCWNTVDEICLFICVNILQRSEMIFIVTKTN